MNPKTYRWTSIGIAVFVAVATVVRVSITDPDRLKTTGLLHYSLHMVAFAAIALPGALSFPRGMRWVLVWMVVSVLGFGTELFEHLYAKDVLEWDDIVTNSGGAMLGVLLAQAFFEQLRSRRRV